MGVDLRKRPARQALCQSLFLRRLYIPCLTDLPTVFLNQAFKTLTWHPCSVTALLSIVENIQTAAQCFPCHMWKEGMSKHSQNIANHSLVYQLCLVTKHDSTTKRKKIVLHGGWCKGTYLDADKIKTSHCIWKGRWEQSFIRLAAILTGDHVLAMTN